MMTAREIRQFEMLLRVCDFGNTHHHLLAAVPMAQETCAAIAAAINDVSTMAVTKVSESESARAARKMAAREALVAAMFRVRELARVLRARGRVTPAFGLPDSRGDQPLLTAARQFARDIRTLDADFAAHGIGSERIGALAAAFDNAMRERARSRAGYTDARVRIQHLLSTALLDVRRLDLILAGEFGRDRVLQSVWRHARHVERPPRRIAAAAEADTTALALAPAASTAPAANAETTERQAQFETGAVVVIRLAVAAVVKRWIPTRSLNRPLR